MSDLLPKKTREFHNHHFDSTIWNDFEFRDDDVIIGTYAKSGTTWVQQIVSRLIATQTVPLGGLFWDGGATTFINKGTNGRWRDVLTADDSARYEQMARERLGEDCARWLATGELAG